MANEFKILRGNKSTLIDENGVAKISADKLINGYWYLTNDTAEVFVCLEVDGVPTLKKINDCDINNDFPDMETFEGRLSALESENKVHTYGYRAGFPPAGVEGHLYIAVDEQKTYVYFSDVYQVVGEINEETAAPDIIFGGTADQVVK